MTLVQSTLNYVTFKTPEKLSLKFIEATINYHLWYCNKVLKGHIQLSFTTLLFLSLLLCFNIQASHKMVWGYLHNGRQNLHILFLKTTTSYIASTRLHVVGDQVTTEYMFMTPCIPRLQPSHRIALIEQCNKW